MLTDQLITHLTLLNSFVTDQSNGTAFVVASITFSVNVRFTRVITYQSSSAMEQPITSTFPASRDLAYAARTT